MYNTKVQIVDHLHFCKISFFNECNDNIKYALYIYDRGEVTKLSYNDHSEFTYFYKHDFSVISLKLFTKNIDNEALSTQSFPNIYSYRICKSLENLSFEESFEVDYISNWRTPVRYIKNKNSENKRLLVFLNGALSNKSRYPLYNRISWQEKFNSDCLYIYDSSLSQDHSYLLAWYVGNSQNILYQEIIRLIRKARDDLGFHNNQIVFYGSSGGGFAALKLAEYFKESTAVAINPQIEIFNYGNKNAVDNFIRFTFNKIPPNLIKDKYQKWIKIDPNAFRCGSSKFIYVQNIVDGEHYRVHLKPFWKHFSKNIESGFDDSNHNQLIIYDHPSGHAGEPPEVLEKILSKLEEM